MKNASVVNADRGAPGQAGAGHVRAGDGAAGGGNKDEALLRGIWQKNPLEPSDCAARAGAFKKAGSEKGIQPVYRHSVLSKHLPILFVYLFSAVRMGKPHG